MEPYDMAPVQNRLTISLAGSTSSRGTGVSASRKRNKPRSVQALSVSPSADREKAL
jgi:hypothetical protein